MVKLQLLRGIPRFCQNIVRFWEMLFFSNRKRSEIGTDTLKKKFEILGHMMHPTVGLNLTVHGSSRPGDGLRPKKMQNFLNLYFWRSFKD